jgi:hypothetical protein
MKIKIPEVAGLTLSFALMMTSVQRARAQIAAVSVQTQVLGRTIPRDFVGLSLEVSQGGQGLQALRQNQRGGGPAPEEKAEYSLGHPGAPNTDFFQFMRNLGPGVLRLGGNSQDNTCWDPQAAPHPGWCQAPIRPGNLQLYSQAAESSGWQLILGLNLKQNSPQWALREVTEGIAPNIKPGQLLGLEIGNEPDLFRRAGRSQSYSPTDHAREFLSYVRAFQHNAIAKNYAAIGPATCCTWRNAENLGLFIDGVARENLRLITVHNYSESVCGGKVVTAAQLLAPGLLDPFEQAAQAWVAAVRSRGLPLALAETNSASCGGMPGVSNAFTSTVWGLDYMYSMAQAGFRYINFHISYRPGGSSYNAVDTFGRQDASGNWHYRNVAEPLYYAMYLFARNASGKHLLKTAVAGHANIRAFAVSSCKGCAVGVFVINKDLQAAGKVVVRAGGRTQQASLLAVQAPNLGSTALQVKYGGVQFDSHGHLPTPHRTQLRPDARGDYTFFLPNASAALLTISGRN